MRIALISDLHGNAVSLRAVLDALAGERVDRIVCLGDVATLGPAPSEVIGRLVDLGCPCILGNHDAFLLDADLIRTYTESPLIVQSVAACRASLGRTEIEALTSFQPTLSMDLDGADLGLFHGSPDRTQRTCWPRPHPISWMRRSGSGGRPSWRADTRTSRWSGSTVERCS